MITRTFLNSPVRRGCIRMVSVRLVHNYFNMIAVLTVILAGKKRKKKSNGKKIRQQRDRDKDKTVLLLAKQ